MALAAAMNWKLFQLNINNAYLHNFIDEELYWNHLKVIAKRGQVRCVI